MSTNPRIRALLDEFATRLEELIRDEALNSVMTALGSTPAPSAAKAKVTNPSSKASPDRIRVSPKQPRGRRSPEQLKRDADKVLGYLKTNPGARGEVVSRAVRLVPNEWTLTIAKLVKDGRVKAKGEKRSRAYWVA